MARKIRGKNEGSISKRSNGTWRAQVSVNGRRISKGFKTKVECQVWLRKMQDKLDQGFDFQGGKVALEKYLQEWLRTSKAGLRDKTAHQYEQIVRNHIIPRIGAVKLRDLRTQMFERFYTDMLDAGVGVRTVRLTHAVLHRALEKAVGYGLVMRNPVHGATLPRKSQIEMLVLDESEVSQFLVAAHNSSHLGLYHVAVTTGMRQGELFGLKWPDLKWNSGTFYVRRQLQYVPGQGQSFIEPKTKAGRRTIKLGEGTLQVLRQHKEKQQHKKTYAGKRWQDNDLIFPSSVGTPLNPSNMRRDFNKVLDNAGLPRIRFHDLRHTAASLMLNNGVPVLVVSKMLGHSKPSMTLNIYGHLYLEKQDEAAKVMDELVTPIRVELSSKTKQEVLN